MKNTKVTQAVVGVAAAMAITVTVGKIIPMNLHANPAGFSATTIANDDCCGPYAQPGCSEFSQADPK
jgi:hypothetical protein